MSDVRRFDLEGGPWGKLKVLRPIVRDGADSWGCLAPLRGTPLGKLVPVVTGDAFSHALHGYIDPLLREIGPEPRSLLRLIPKSMRPCGMAHACVVHDKISCVMGHPKVPDCFTPSGIQDAEMADAVAKVLLAWAEGRYVVVVEGEEFAL